MLNQQLLDGCKQITINGAIELDLYFKAETNSQLILTSGFRTPARNAEVGGAPNSDHTKGLAFDGKSSDQYNIFYHVSNIYKKIIDKDGIFAYVTKMEIVRDVVDKGKPTARWENHLHLSFSETPVLERQEIFFTGTYS